jgi:heme exporter protein A
LNGLLSANDLCLLRGDRCLFQNLEFALNPGELLFIEGANGSGKTSLLRGIAGLLDFETGHVSWDGQKVADAYQLFRSELVWLSHRVGFKEELNLLENLQFESTLRSSSMENADAVIERLSLARLGSLPFRYLSAGQQRRVALARMVLANARLWMMDEPFTNLDKAGRGLVAELISEHLGGGGMCIIASHQTVEIDAPTKRVTLQ